VDPVAQAALASWSWDPWIVFVLLVAALVYLRGFRELRRQLPERFPAWRAAAWLASLALLAFAIASPLDAFGELLLQVHMLQHLIMIAFVPPLLWLGAPFAPLLRGLPSGWLKEGLGPFLRWPALQRFVRGFVHPVFAWLSFVIATWVWHAPALYELALRDPFWHEVEHLFFFGTGLLFWYPVVQPWPSRSVWPRWAMVPYLILADLQNTAFSAVFAFSERVIYPAYESAPRIFGISALDDQAAAGAIMWVPGSLVFLAPVGVILVRELTGGLGRPGGRPSPREVPARSRARAQRPLDLLRLPVLGRLLGWRHLRTLAQLLMFGLAAVVILDGLLGPQMPSALNLAGVLPWNHWRGFVVIGLLVAGNLFCFACPFMLPRRLAKRLLPAARAWPRALRSKWLAVALLALYLFSYEAFDLWDSPFLTAWIAIGYFAAAFTIDGLFRGASFCKYVCPIGQFHFVQSTLSPLEVKVREPARCGSCETRDCIRGNAQQRGCEVDLFQPAKVGNLDCTFCLDCVHACPHDNVGILATRPAQELASDASRVSLGKLSERPDLAALVLLLSFGAFANAAAMTAPVVAWQQGSASAWSLSPSLVWVLFFAATLIALPALCALLASGADRERLSRFAWSLAPIGFSMWLAHFVMHFAMAWGGAATAWRRAFADLGLAQPPLVSAMPGMTMAALPSLPGGLAATPALLLLALDAGLVASVVLAWRIAGGRLALAIPWALVALLLWCAGIWIFAQAMEMRGMSM